MLTDDHYQGRKRGINEHFIFMTHTIVLIQPYPDKTSRTFSDHETLSQAIDYFINGYENRLKELNPNIRNLKYEMKDLMNYIDNLPDLGILTFDKKMTAYVPHDREWLKNRVYQHLQKSLK